MTNFSTAKSYSVTQTNTAQRAPVNNAILDPLQGFDADIFVLDQGTGEYVLVGRFVSLQITVRNATEPYLELNQRQPRYLDGEFQIGWVLERGMLDARVLEQTMGYRGITRGARISRSPRFQITFRVDAPELAKIANSAEAKSGGTPDSDSTKISGASNRSSGFKTRRAAGELVLSFCKVDSMTIGATAGRSVIANRWEGMAEGIEQIDRQQQNENLYAGTILGKGEDAYIAAVRASDKGAALKPFDWDAALLNNYRTDINESETDNKFPDV